jgi:hypothetical protein
MASPSRTNHRLSFFFYLVCRRRRRRLKEEKEKGTTGKVKRKGKKIASVLFPGPTISKCVE